MTRPGTPAVRIGVAAVVATVGIVAAVLVDQRVVSALIGAAAAAFALWTVGSLRPEHPTLARRGAGVVVASILLFGIPAVAVLTPSGIVGAEQESSDERIEPGDLSAALKRALDRADEVAPNGAESILQIEIDGDRETLYVLDQRTGMQVYTYRSGENGWYAPTSARTSQRTVFGRSDLARLDLNGVRDRVVSAWERVGSSDPSSPESAKAPSVKIEPRSADGRVVARFVGGGFPIESDTSGNLADTVDAASIDRFLDVASRVMTAAGLEPDAKVLYRIEFRSLDEAASRHGRFESGFELYFDGGPISSIAVDVGSFPVVRKATTTDEPDGFSLTGLTGATMASVRDDLARRRLVPAYDRDAIGAKIGVARNDDHPGRVPVTIQMVVGPSSTEVAGVYSTRGRFLRDGTD
ncbi:hypothetical protein [Gordonia phthalatica]|uniref:Uncharacterized protein n=1 Tax=Gordonia phthalatica TaxID=1136941 RepID=A0A0N9N997_9ACTN|nr:hypothetical protein [Gordonia phthalatica]ALG84784.1 hypothetical protein ACH46_10100 [Gordonia phthalatica]